MSASLRKISRLPLEVFENLGDNNNHHGGGNNDDDDTKAAMVLRSLICAKLQRLLQKKKKKDSCIPTVGDVLQLSPFALLQTLDPLLTFEEIEILWKRICQQCAAKPTNAWTLLYPDDNNGTVTARQQQRQRRLRSLPTGLPSLDQMDGSISAINNISSGILRVGAVTELVGPAGVGKSQLACQLVVLAAQHHKMGCVWVDTERKRRFVLTRVQEMSLEQTQRRIVHQNLGRSSGSSNRTAPLEHIPVIPHVIMKEATTVDDLTQALVQAEDDILNRNQSSTQPSLDDDNNEALFPIRLLIVDSIAAPFWQATTTNDENSSSFAASRAIAAMSMAQTLKRLADQLQLAVVVMNQVGSSSSGRSSFGEEQSSPYGTRPALGTSWHHCVSTRLVLEPFTNSTEQQYHDDYNRDEHTHNDNHNNTRSLIVAKSNVMAYQTLQFQITAAGIVQVSPSPSPPTRRLSNTRE